MAKKKRGRPTAYALLYRALRDYCAGHISWENVAYHADLTIEELAWLRPRVCAGDNGKMCEAITKEFLRTVRGMGVVS